MIVDFEQYINIKHNLGTIVCASGGFDPIHPGHISYLQHAKRLGDTLVVIVNGDHFLTVKKGKPFQDIDTRCHIVDGIKGVDYVYPFRWERDQSVCEALRALTPNIFANGGDQTGITIPEVETCIKLDIQMEFGVGVNKEWSSLNFLQEWAEFKNGQFGDT